MCNHCLAHTEFLDALDEMIMANTPDYVNPKIAYVISIMGKYVLRVRGIHVAVQGDVLRDPRYKSSVWDKPELEDAAAIINGERRLDEDFIS